MFSRSSEICEQAMAYLTTTSSGLCLGGLRLCRKLTILRAVADMFSLEAVSMHLQAVSLLDLGAQHAAYIGIQVFRPRNLHPCRQQFPAVESPVR